MRTALSLLTSLVLLCATAATGETRDKVPFKWDSRFASAGTSLTLVETSRTKLPQGTLIVFEPRASGFPQATPLVLWVNYGSEYISLPATVNAAGVVGIAQMPDGLGMIGPVKGQALDVALTLPGNDLRAQAKVIPFPIEARGDSGCAATAELISPNGDLFAITFTGFKPAERVETTSTFKKEVRSGIETANEKGEVVILVMHSRRGGAASVSAKGSTCTVTLQYAVGRNALAAQ